ncbi:hypothetical protein QJS10_CPB15g01951 [Acorus calamus]|uniref:ACT domain-containing protein n=1 Tax=Acorus calamus TaxID=4465 RepID=A0AAV9D778_ACOCL|nr:hypothetical protein QJS10_CPB15g01951 [Acorus calamus]
MTMLRERNERSETAKIRVCVSNPSSKIDSMIGALRCLKGMNVGARTVRARFDGAELAATIDIQTKIATSEVEKAVASALMEVERKFGFSFHERSGASLEDTWLTQAGSL